MAKARYLVEAHVLEGVRFASSPLRTGASQLAQGHDAGAETVAYHLAQHHEDIPSVSTIWRILRREGLVVAQRQKRPRSSLSRFQAELPNELRQAGITAWQPASGEVVEILNQIDDHSRLFLGSDAYLRVKAPDVVESFHKAAELHGLPASPLSDNGAVFTGSYRGGKVLLEYELEGGRRLQELTALQNRPRPGPQGARDQASERRSMHSSDRPRGRADPRADARSKPQLPADQGLLSVSRMSGDICLRCLATSHDAPERTRTSTESPPHGPEPDPVRVDQSGGVQIVQVVGFAQPLDALDGLDVVKVLSRIRRSVTPATLE